ncbi:MAG: hypothetical protein OXH76_05310 [Boseongicola sp.]|nr:hypothetical protein [Boseongicola sp.]
MASFQAHSTSDCETCDQMLRDAHYPFVKLHDRKTGQVVSAIQAGVALRRSGAGAVRPPRADLTEAEDEAMRGAIGEGPQDVDLEMSADSPEFPPLRTKVKDVPRMWSGCSLRCVHSQ